MMDAQSKRFAELYMELNEENRKRARDMIDLMHKYDDEFCAALSELEKDFSLEKFDKLIEKWKGMDVA